MDVRVLTYEAIDRAAWCRLVEGSETGTWFQRPEAYELFASQPALFEPFALAAVRGTELRAVCVGYMTKETNRLKQYFMRRAIIPSGVCPANDATEEEVRALLAAVRQQVGPQVIYIELRNFNDYSRWRQAFETEGFAYRPHLNFHVDTQDFESRLSDNRRRQIRKAEPLATIGEATTEDDIVAWYAVLSDLYRTKVRTPLWPVGFFVEAYRQGVATFLMVKHAGRVIGGSMVVRDARSVYEWFECGRNAAYRDAYPSVMATYAGIRWAREHGCCRYDMMGAGEPGVPYGVRDFKSEFGGRLVEHGRYVYITKPLLYKIGASVVRLLRQR